MWLLTLIKLAILNCIQCKSSKQLKIYNKRDEEPNENLNEHGLLVINSALLSRK